MKKAIERRALQGSYLCSEAPIISYLLFADDTIIFCEATLDQTQAIKNILRVYEIASGQTVNFLKSDVTFSKGVPTECR